MGYLTITRPINCAITFVSVLVGAWIGKNVCFSFEILLAGIIGFIVCAFGNIVNDLYDIEIDRINNPHRPLPSGTVKKSVVTWIAILLFAISLFLSMTLGIVPFLIVLGVLVSLFLYAMYLKRMPIANFVVSLIAGISFVFGGVVAKNPYFIFPFVFSVFIHMPREIIKDVTDIKGDRDLGVVSLPILLGPVWSFNIGAFLLAILCVILPIPFISRIFNVVYITIILLFAYPIIVYTIVRLLKNPGEAELPKLSTLLKISMFIGLMAMLLS